MKKKASTVLLFALYACSGIARAPEYTPSYQLQINVVNSADTSMVLPGVSVYLVDNHGRVKKLGATDKFGDITISKGSLQGAVVVVFHHKLFFSGALQVAEDDLLHYDERLMALAPIVVR